jgi:hypothetical protein
VTGSFSGTSTAQIITSFAPTGSGSDLAAISVRPSSTAATGSYLIAADNAAGTTKFYVTDVGTVFVKAAIGVNTAVTTAAIDVTSGQILSRSMNVGSGTTIDFNNGNVQYTSVAPPTTITLNNMLDGGSYTLICTSSTSGTFSFTTTGLTQYFSPANGATAGTSGGTVYTFIRAGSNVWISWITGF